MENAKFDLAPIVYRPIGTTEALRLSELALAEKIQAITQESLARLKGVSPQRFEAVGASIKEGTDNALRLIKARDLSPEALAEGYQKHCDNAKKNERTAKTREAWEAGVRTAEDRKSARRGLLMAGEALVLAHRAVSGVIADIRTGARNDRRKLSDQERAVILALSHDAATMEALTGQVEAQRATA